MPQAATPNMGLVRPVESGDSGIWASLLDACFDLIDQHDHSTGKGVKVSMANGVSVAADIPWSSGGNFYAITGLKAIDFQPQPQSAMSTFAGALFVDSANNELSYRTTGGSIIRFTNGATFNFSAIGAIGGDYSAVGALVDFVDANDVYRFRQQLGGGVQQYARIDCGGLDLFEYKANPAVGVPANRVRMSSPAALAASYDMTWPGALPGSTQLTQVDSTGQWSMSNTVVNDLTMTANKNVILSGTGVVKHGTKTRTMSASANKALVAAGTVIPAAAGSPKANFSASTNAYYELPTVALHERILNVKVWFDAAPAGGNTTIAVFSMLPGGGFVAVGGSVAGNTITLQVTGINFLLSASQLIFVNVSNPAGVTCTVVSISIDYDVP